MPVRDAFERMDLILFRIDSQHFSVDVIVCAIITRKNRDVIQPNDGLYSLPRLVESVGETHNTPIGTMQDLSIVIAGGRPSTRLRVPAWHW